jgi:hypothetical protein
LKQADTNQLRSCDSVSSATYIAMYVALPLMQVFRAMCSLSSSTGSCIDSNYWLNLHLCLVQKLSIAAILSATDQLVDCLVLHLLQPSN